MSADGTIPEARTSADTSSWYTPAYIVDAARAFLGGRIDLDPASCALANRTIGAKRFITEEEDALSCDWGSGLSIFCNPPSPPRPWWKKMRETLEHSITGQRAVFVGYSIETLQQFQDDLEWFNEWRICIPSKRVKYETTAGDRVRVLQWRKETPALKRQLEALLAVPPDTLVTGDAPSHASVLFGWGPADDWRAAFSHIGACR